MSADRARRLIERQAGRDPAVVELASIASMAVRLDSVLLRALRTELLPQVDVGAEADLWFSALVESRGVDYAVLDPTVASVLRTELAADRARLDAAFEVTSSAHAHHPPSLRLEERVGYLSARGGQNWLDEVNVALRPALRTIADGGDAARDLAHWALRVLPNLAPDILETDEGFALLMAAQAIVGPIFDDVPEVDVSLDHVRWALPPESMSTTVELHVELLERGIRFESTGAGDGRLPLPQTSPLLLQLEWRATTGETATTLVEPIPGRSIDLGSPVDEILIRTLAGDQYILERDPLEASGLEQPAAAPASTGGLVGREEELGTLLDLIGEGEKLIVVSGPQGVGKTTLVNEVVSRIDERNFPDGVGIALRWSNESAEDLLQELWERVAGSLDVSGLPDPAAVRRDLLRVEAVVVLSDVQPDHGRDVLQVVDAMPSSVFLVTTDSEVRDDGRWQAPTVHLDGHSIEDALVIFEARLLDPIPDEARADLASLIERVGGNARLVTLLADMAFAEVRFDWDGTGEEPLTAWLRAKAGLSTDELFGRPEPMVDITQVGDTPVPREVLSDSIPVERGLRVLISSSMPELRDERRLVRETLSEIGHVPFTYEDDARASVMRAGQTWADEIDNSDVCLAILASSLGAYTRDEVAMARERGLPVLVFVKRPEPGADTETPVSEDIDSFVDEISGPETGLAVAYFSDLNDLSRLVQTSLDQLATDLGTRRRDALVDEPPRRRRWWQRFRDPSRRDKRLVYVSYRRADVASVERMRELLERRLDKHRLFVDSTSLPAGADWQETIEGALDDADVVLAVIGPNWSAGDWILQELERSFARNAVVVPVLVGGAAMPAYEELPPSVAELAERQAFVLSDDADIDRLAAAIESLAE